MKTLAESFEKEVTEEGELEPSARCACFQHLPDMHSLIPPQQGLPALTAFNVGAYPRPRAVSMCRVCRCSGRSNTSLVSDHVGDCVRCTGLTGHELSFWAGCGVTPQLHLIRSCTCLRPLPCAGRWRGWGRWMPRSTWTRSSTSSCPPTSCSACAPPLPPSPFPQDPEIHCRRAIAQLLCPWLMLSECTQDAVPPLG